MERAAHVVAHTSLLAAFVPSALVAAVVTALATVQLAESYSGITALCEAFPNQVGALLRDPTLHQVSPRLSLLMAKRALGTSATAAEQVTWGIYAIPFLLQLAERASGDEDVFLNEADQILTNIVELARQQVKRLSVLFLLDSQDLARLRDTGSLTWLRDRLLEATGEHWRADTPHYALLEATIAKAEAWQRVAAGEALKRLESYSPLEP